MASYTSDLISVLHADGPTEMTAGLNNRPKEWSRPPEPTCRTRDVGAAATSGDRM
jgi:hypothetical protein